MLCSHSKHTLALRLDQTGFLGEDDSRDYFIIKTHLLHQIMILTGRLLFLMYSWILFSRIDSIMLVEEGFNLVSVDASDKMLKYALKARWDRRKEPAFDQWGMKI